jgi:hypothetical protein
VPVGDYAPGAHATNPAGLSKGVEAVHGEFYPKPIGRTRRQQARAEQKALEAENPKRRGRPMGSKNRPPPTQEMFDGPPDVA